MFHWSGAKLLIAWNKVVHVILIWYKYKYFSAALLRVIPSPRKQLVFHVPFLWVWVGNTLQHLHRLMQAIVSAHSVLFSAPLTDNCSVLLGPTYVAPLCASSHIASCFSTLMTLVVTWITAENSGGDIYILAQDFLTFMGLSTWSYYFVVLNIF